MELAKLEFTPHGTRDVQIVGLQKSYLFIVQSLIFAGK
jgi:hypothetical protein